jgi:hypothetical protein
VEPGTGGDVGASSDGGVTVACRLSGELDGCPHTIGDENELHCSTGCWQRWSVRTTKCGTRYGVSSQPALSPVPNTPRPMMIAPVVLISSSTIGRRRRSG